jgi:hypothetical protein
VSLEVDIKGVPSEEVLKDLVARAREEGADRIVVATTHDAGDA